MLIARATDRANPFGAACRWRPYYHRLKITRRRQNSPGNLENNHGCDAMLRLITKLSMCAQLLVQVLLNSRVAEGVFFLFYNR